MTEIVLGLIEADSVCMRAVRGKCHENVMSYATLYHDVTEYNA